MAVARLLANLVYQFRTVAMHLSDRVYSKLKNMILSGQFKPNTGLSERSLAARLSVSRVPVREAIKLLEREGLLIVVPRSGILVRRLSIEEVCELYEVRQAIEGMAAFLSAGSRRAEIVEIRKQLEKLDAARNIDHAAIQRASTAFHRKLFELCGNSQLRAIYESVEPKIDLNLRLTAVHGPERVEQALRAHLKIAKAIEAGDGVSAERLIRADLENGKTARIGILTRLQARDLDASDTKRRKVA
jgi:DNA-binding GntR family transcriptional regulator